MKLGQNKNKNLMVVTVFTVFSRESFFADTQIIVLCVEGRTGAIVLTRPAAARCLQGQQN